jgi:AcrR family transcriptional regulator
MPYVASGVKARAGPRRGREPGAGAAPAALGRLPRGPHRLSRQEVAASQRTRMLRAVTDLVADNGLGRTTITGICRRAGVAPNAFYEHFATKEECYLAAYDDFVSQILHAIADAVDPGAGPRSGPAGKKRKSGGDWGRLVTQGIGAYLGLLDARPTEARAFVLQVDGAGPEAREHLRLTLNAVAKTLRRQHLAMRAENPDLGPLPDAAYLGFAHGVRALVCESMLEDPTRPLMRLLPDLTAWMNSTVSGASRAG